jgi:hypothetical protein
VVPHHSSHVEARLDPWQPEEGHHYTVKELAKCWNVSSDFVRQLFAAEADVLRWINHRPGKRRYIVVRVPALVAERVYKRAQAPRPRPTQPSQRQV